MRLIALHRLLISAFLGLLVLMVAWGVAAVRRGEPGAWIVLAVGALPIAPAALYLRKLYRNPPIK